MFTYSDLNSIFGEELLYSSIISPFKTKKILFKLINPKLLAVMKFNLITFKVQIISIAEKIPPKMLTLF